MKREPNTAMLVVIFAIATLGTVVVCYQFLKEARMAQRLQQQSVAVNQRKALLQSLVMELNEYSRRDPAIIPTLDRLNMRPRPATNSASAANE